jgi:heptosyltransferase-1
MVFMKIAIVKLSALGDIIHAMIVVQFIKNNNNKILIDWIVEKDYKELLEFHPDINKIHTINIKKAKKKKSLLLLFKELKKTKQFGPYDLVIDMQGLIKSAIISRLTPSAITLGFHKTSTRERIASIFYNKTFKYGYDENVIERNLAIIEFALGLDFNKNEILKNSPFLYTSKKYVYDDLSNTKKNILLIPGASYLAKCYPMEKFVELTKKIDTNFIIIWGNENERAVANKIKYQSTNINVNVSEALSFDALISLINQVDLVIGSDTGPTHMAWALNIPSITLFGSTPGYRNTYVTNINKIVESDSKVNPLKINKKDYSINDINEVDIVNLAKNLL